MQALRQALDMAERRDAIDAELVTAQAAIAQLPAIAVGDPQAVMTAGLNQNKTQRSPAFRPQ